MLEKSDPSLTFDARDHESKVILSMSSWNNSVSVNIDIDVDYRELAC